MGQNFTNVFHLNYPKEPIRVLMLGLDGVGKTKIIQTFDKGIKPSHTTPTVGVDYCSKKIQV